MTATLVAALLAGFPPEPDYKAAVRVRTDKELRKVPDGIFGVAAMKPEKVRAYGLPLTRWGGNRTSRYNWKTDCDSAAADWYFLNGGTPNDDPLRCGYLRAARDNRKAGAGLYLTVPTLGWVAKDGSSYGFSVKKYGKQRGHEPGKPDVGDGVRPDGSLVTGNDPRDTSVPAGPDFVAGAVVLCREQLGPAGEGGVPYWALDNEPMLWHKTHRDVHPDPLGYDGLWDRTAAYAAAVKKADPTALVAGFVSWGWLDLYYSARDDVPGKPGLRPDFDAHGKVPLAEWFLTRTGAYRRANGGRRLIDVFDMHWYPQAQAGGRDPFTGTGTDAALNALRLRTVRELWDPAYRTESWIKDVTPEPLKILRRVRGWIEKHDPGLKLCLGEYNFGGADTVTGGLAQADAFGVFAREGVDLAFLWTEPAGSQELAWALYRNYDGKGGRFGGGLLDAASDHADLSAYAARRGDGTLTVVLVNKRLGGACDVTLDAGDTAGRGRLWRFDAARPDAVREAADRRAFRGRPVTLTLPPASATLVAIGPE